MGGRGHRGQAGRAVGAGRERTRVVAEGVS